MKKETEHTIMLGSVMIMSLILVFIMIGVALHELKQLEQQEPCFVKCMDEGCYSSKLHNIACDTFSKRTNMSWAEEECLGRCYNIDLDYLYSCVD